MTSQNDKRWILLGASRGFGQAFAESIGSENSVVVASRKSSWSMDFSRKENWQKYLAEIFEQKPTHLVYFAGGGPFGNFAAKQWKDHEWAFQVTYEFPAYLLHSLAQVRSQGLANLQQVCLIGSSVAESSADPGAASYSAAKHALLGLVKSLHQENVLPFDLRLFSPGYINTDLLPAHAWPRQVPGLVKEPKDVAQSLLDWLLNPDKINQHLVISTQA